MTVPIGTPKVAATCATVMSARWCSAITSRWPAGSCAERLKQDDVTLGIAGTRLLHKPRSESDEALRTPPPAAGEVDCDRPEPGLRIFDAEQPPGMVERTHERLLDHVLCLRHAAGDADELGEQAAV